MGTTPPQNERQQALSADDVTRLVRSEIDSYFARLWSRTKWAAGLVGVVATVLVGGQIKGFFNITKAFSGSLIASEVTRQIESGAFQTSISSSVSKSFKDAIGISYEDHFWLGGDPTSRQRYILFYANPGSEVEAMIEIAHKGTKAERNVKISVDLVPVPPDQIDYFLHPTAPALGYLPWRISDYIKPKHFTSDPSLHMIIFDTSGPSDTDDLVSVNILINVIGKVSYISSTDETQSGEVKAEK